MTTYTWIIKSMTVLPSYMGQTNVVSTIYWSYVATDSSTPPNTTHIDGQTAVPYVAGASFTPYANLTPAEVQSWLTALLDPRYVTAMQNMLNARIALMVAPPTVTMNLPWEATS